MVDYNASEELLKQSVKFFLPNLFLLKKQLYKFLYHSLVFSKYLSCILDSLLNNTLYLAVYNLSSLLAVVSAAAIGITKVLCLFCVSVLNKTKFITHPPL